MWERNLTLYLFDISFISQHLKTYSYPNSKYKKILTENTSILNKEKQIKTPNS